MPVVYKIPDGLEEFRNVIRQSIPIREDANYKHGLIRDLEWLVGAAKEHASIDTLAKKLTITEHHDMLVRLKVALSLYFTYLQNVTKPDYRYDGFFASIIKDSSLNPPKTLNIVTWNYDSQLEIAVESFIRPGHPKTPKSMLNVYGKSEGSSRVPDNNTFSVFKINGTAGFKTEKRSDKKYIYHSTDVDRSALIDDVLKWYGQAIEKKELSSLLSFSWESEIDDPEKEEMPLPTDAQLKSLAPFKPITDQEVAGQPKQNVNFNISPASDGNLCFSINGQPFSMSNPPRMLTLNTASEWEITSSRANHPYHIHVNSFQIVKVIKPDGRAQIFDPPLWKDTYLVKVGEQVILRSRYEDFIGTFVIHCHILDHEDQGMMELVKIVNKNPT